MLWANAGNALEGAVKASWDAELPYFRWLHRQLPEPFFQTQGFLLFCAAILALYWALPRKWNTARVWLLVIASFHFYAAWNASLAVLVTGTTVLDYFLARMMGHAHMPALRKLLVTVSVCGNLGLLAYFKYRGFFLNELHDLGTRIGTDLGYEKLDLKLLGAFVPFGISFYTFEAISYAVDVYRKKIEPERSLPHFLLFILFFPHLVAGPIVRAGDFLRQARRIKTWNWVRVQVGVQLFLLGAFKKLAIGDRMAVFCDPVLADPGGHSSSAVWLAVLAYALRIYADFSGYSDMAVGTAHLFGFKLTQNFAMPYFAVNVTDFWRRWHISLSTWLRDYVFIPLGGSRGTAWFTARNLLITMALGGLWHGANWTYVLWGVLHGVALIAHKAFVPFAQARPTLNSALQSKLGTVLRVATTFSFVSFCWIFFRPEWEPALATLRKMIFISDGTPLVLHNRSLWYTVVFVVACHAAVAFGIWQKVWQRAPAAAMGLGYAICLTAAMLLAPDSGKPFIYFAF
jgi:alginate O-acetyltransferase complex protein AlgI